MAIAHKEDSFFSPLLGESPEAMGFGLWKGKAETKNSIKYVNKVREKEDSKTIDHILDKLRKWEKKSF